MKKTIGLSVLFLFFNLLNGYSQSKPILRINHLAIFVKDMQASREFYTGFLQLDSIPEPFKDNKHLWLNIGGGASMHIIEGATEKKEYFLNNHLCLSTNDFAAFKAKVESRKIPYYNAGGEKGKITSRVDGISQLWIQDPDGYWLEINDDYKKLN